MFPYVLLRIRQDSEGTKWSYVRSEPRETTKMYKVFGFRGSKYLHRRPILLINPGVFVHFEDQ